MATETTEQDKPKRGLTRAERIDALEKRAREIQDRARALRAQERASRAKADRKADTHRKVVLGGAILELLRRGVLDGDTYDGLIAQANLSDRDREAIQRSAFCPAPDSGATDGPEMALRSEA